LKSSTCPLHSFSLRGPPNPQPPLPRMPNAVSSIMDFCWTWGGFFFSFVVGSLFFVFFFLFRFGSSPLPPPTTTLALAPYSPPRNLSQEIFSSSSLVQFPKPYIFFPFELNFIFYLVRGEESPSTRTITDYFHLFSQPLFFCNFPHAFLEPSFPSCNLVSPLFSPSPLFRITGQGCFLWSFLLCH